MNPADAAMHRRRRAPDQRPAPQHPEEGRAAPPAPTHPAPPRAGGGPWESRSAPHAAGCPPMRSPCGSCRVHHRHEQQTKPTTAISAWTTITGMGRPCSACAGRRGKNPPSAATKNTIRAVRAVPGCRRPHHRDDQGDEPGRRRRPVHQRDRSGRPIGAPEAHRRHVHPAQRGQRRTARVRWSSPALPVGGVTRPWWMDAGVPPEVTVGHTSPGVRCHRKTVRASVP